MPIQITNKGKALVLGMVFAAEDCPKRGQEFRDRVRCEALENFGYEVFSLDNKHSQEGDEVQKGKHCKANFADARRMAKAIRETWGWKADFDVVILDYFFSPVGWARERWTDAFFRDSLPLLAEADILKKTGEIWLPNLSCVRESLTVFKKELGKYYTWELVRNPHKNPLFRATHDAAAELRRCPDNLTNETQIKPLDPEMPFYVLRYRDPRLAGVPGWLACTPPDVLGYKRRRHHTPDYSLSDVTPRSLLQKNGEFSHSPVMKQPEDSATKKPMSRELKALLASQPNTPNSTSAKSSSPRAPPRFQTIEEVEEICCEVCFKHTNADALLLCDGCDHGYHFWCHTPPLSGVPKDDWYCFNCVSAGITKKRSRVMAK